MTYYQIIKSALLFWKNEKLPTEFFEYWWIQNKITFEGLEITLPDGIKDLSEETIEKRRKNLERHFQHKITYLVFYELNKKKLLNEHSQQIFRAIEYSLTSFIPNPMKLSDNLINHLEKEIFEDSWALDMISQLLDETLDEDIKTKIKIELNKHIKDVYGPKYGYLGQTISDTAIENINIDTVLVIPELFFTEKGYKYIPECFHIEDSELRKKLYEYVRRQISRYPLNTGNYETEIYLDDPSTLYYGIKLSQIVISLVKSNQLNKLKRLMLLDEALEFIENHKINPEIDRFLSYFDWKTGVKNASVVSEIYDVRIIYELDYSQDAFKKIEKDNYLEFFLSDTSLTSSLSIYEIALILLSYFDYDEVDKIEAVLNQFSTIERILSSDSRRTQKIRQLRRLSKSVFERDFQQKILDPRRKI